MRSFRLFAKEIGIVFRLKELFIAGSVLAILAAAPVSAKAKDKPQARGKVAHPMKVVIGRILHEIQDPTEKYHIFVRPPAKEDEWRGPRRGP